MMAHTVLIILALVVAICSNGVDAGGACERGLRKGQMAVASKWDYLGEDCDEIFGLEGSVKRMAQHRFRDRRSNNWREREINRCARIGAADQVKRYEEECLETDSGVCDDMAESAAESIVFKKVCTPEYPRFEGMMMDQDVHEKPNYKKACRNAAIRSCQGIIMPKVKKYCKGRTLRTSYLITLQDMCEDEVENMLPEF
eukprot:1754_1